MAGDGDPATRPGRAGHAPAIATLIEQLRLERRASPVEAVAATACAGSAATGAGSPLDLVPLPADARPEVIADLAREVRRRGVDVGPEALGPVFEAAVDRSERRRRGVHFTPDAVADGLVARALDGLGPGDGLRVLDPTCGAGAFLLATARLLLARGVPAPLIASRCLAGTDRDPGAVWTARVALAWLLGVAPESALTVADPLRVGGTGPDPVPSGVDVVVGNPPFLSQLARRTVRSARARREAHDRFGRLVGPYADGAVLFLLDGLERVRPGGRVAFVLPLSFLASRDAAGARRHLATAGRLRHLWLGGPGVFPEASVEVCAIVVERDDGDQDRQGRMPPVLRSTGATFDPLPAVATTAALGAGRWTGLVSDALGVPTVPTHLLEPDSGPRTVAAEATVTAGFRSEYYAITSCLAEAVGGRAGAGEAPVVSSGLIDPLGTAWGVRPARMARQRWVAPVVDLGRLAARDPAVARWVEARRRPKVLVATQARTLEVVVDEEGELVPLTPVIAVEPRGAGISVWHLAAALGGPLATAVAAARSVGTARSIRAVKLSAPEIRNLPLPEPGSAWDEAAAQAEALTRARAQGDPVTRGAWAAFGRAHCRAFAVADDRVLAWWLDRLGAGHVAPDALDDTVPS